MKFLYDCQNLKLLEFLYKLGIKSASPVFPQLDHLRGIANLHSPAPNTIIISGASYEALVKELGTINKGNK